MDTNIYNRQNSSINRINNAHTMPVLPEPGDENSYWRVWITPVANSVGSSLLKAYRIGNAGVVPAAIGIGTAGAITSGISGGLTAVAAVSDALSPAISAGSLAADALLFASRKIAEHVSPTSSQDPETISSEDITPEIATLEPSSTENVPRGTIFEFGNHAVELLDHAGNYADISSTGATILTSELSVLSGLEQGGLSMKAIGASVMAGGKVAAVVIGGAWVVGLAAGIVSFYLINPHSEETESPSLQEGTPISKEQFISDDGMTSEESRSSKRETISEKREVEVQGSSGRTEKKNKMLSDEEKKKIEIRQKHAEEVHVKRQKAKSFTG